MALRANRVLPLTLVVALLCALSLGAGFALSAKLRKMDEQFTALLQASSDSHRALQQFGLELAAQHRAYLNLIISSEASETALFRESVTESREAIAKSLGQLRGAAHNGFSTNVSGIEEIYSNYQRSGDRLLELLDRNEREAATAFRRENLRPLYQTLSGKLSLAGETLVADSKRQSEEIAAARGSLRTYALALLGWPALLLALVAIAIGVLIWLTTRWDDDERAMGSLT